MQENQPLSLSLPKELLMTAMEVQEFESLTTFMSKSQVEQAQSARKFWVSLKKASKSFPKGSTRIRTNTGRRSSIIAIR